MNDLLVIHPAGLSLTLDFQNAYWHFVEPTGSQSAAKNTKRK
jgi:hypothetical protein